MENLEEGDLVLCTVEKIVGTGVFVKIPVGNKEIEGNIVLSEIAPGRIRNLRDYVVPKKKIVCKILRISQNGNIDLSLRRVTPKEKKEVLEKEKQEKSYRSVLKSILGEKLEEAIKKIIEKEDLLSFFEKAKENSKELDTIVGKKDSERILEILNDQKQKKSIVKKEISLKSISPNGLEIIKNIFKDLKDIKVKYISAGNYSIEKEADNLKEADNTLKELISKIEEQSKKDNFSFAVKN